jgi:dihydropteroate synthase
MSERARYGDVVADVTGELAGRLAALADAGVDPEQTVVDPGIGFAKTAEHNWALLARLDALEQLNRPVLVGASRKRFLGSLLADGDAGTEGEPAPLDRREDATTAVTALVAAAGAWCVRVHDVRASADAVRVAAAVEAARR